MNTRLYLGSTPIRLEPVDGEAIVLSLSLQQLLDAGLQRFPPGEIALEQGIAMTEDALMPHVAALRQHPLEVLEMADDALAPLPALLGQNIGTAHTFGIDAVEQTFNLLADVGAGLPAHRVGFPEQPRFVAALLVVRELMHHVGWSALRLSRDA